MRLLSSLRSRIFLTSALLTVLSLGVATYIVSIDVANEAESALQREITATGRVVDQLRTRSAENFTTMAELIADEPKLKAAAATNDPPTVQDEVARDYQAQFQSSLLLVTGKTAHVLATVGTSPRQAEIVANQPSVHEALAGRVSVSLLPWPPEGMLQLVTVPITIGLKNPEMLGTLSVGFLLDDAFANQLKQDLGGELAFGMDGQILASTLPAADRGQLAELLRHTESAPTVTLGNEEYAALPRPLSAVGDWGVPGAGPIALILRSRSETQRFLRSIHTQLVITLVVAVLLATLLSFAVARTITQPLAAITNVMREVASTGDLTRKIVLRESQRWNDEDARILATTFNTLTDSIARFQVEMSRKERLSSLGRLSTVIAHEVRNPLMNIKAALHTLRQAGATTEDVREAASDIGEEIARLNRIVNEVLDFARPIQFDFAPADLNAVCRESAAAAQAKPGAEVGLDLDASSPKVTTDAERLRGALVNLILNARHAVESSGADDPRVTLSTRVHDGHVAIVVADRGTGIADVDLARVFDPYFTTKRGGTGLGLPITKNIIEGLGGSITVSSVAGRGTDMRIDLPFTSIAS